MSGRIIPTIWGKRWGFPGTGPLPTFWPFMVSLRTVMALLGVSFSMLIYYNECIMRLKVHWKSKLLPSWTWLVLTSFCHVLWLHHSFKGCALPPSLLFQFLLPPNSLLLVAFTYILFFCVELLTNTLILSQTWICLPMHSKANLMTPGCGEGKCSVYCRAAREEPRAAGA